VLLQLKWTKYMTVTTGIGQGITEVTPIAVARYVAAVANGGTVYQAHVVDKVIDQEGNVVFDQQPEVFSELGADEAYIAAIQAGMSNVVSAEEGTAHDAFKNFPQQYLDLIAGKTGTAQVTQVDLENNSWFVCFAPYSASDPNVKPEIAIVVYIPHGYSGKLSSLVAQDILKYYFQRQEIVAEQTIPGTDSLIY
jgi:penicillin-binding protein 2